MEMTNVENALIWLYVKTWGKFGEHIIEKDLWKFTGRDLDTALMGLAYPRKRKSNEKEKTERVHALNDLIMGRFEEGGIDAFQKWSREIYAQVIETLPFDTVDEQVIKPQQQLTPVKILKWDPGKYSILFNEYLSINLKIVNMSLKHQHIEHL